MADKAVFTFGSGSLASRSSAAVVRRDVLRAIYETRDVVLDFSDVHWVAGSYADELVGVIVYQHGLDWLIDHVKFHNATDGVLQSLAEAADIRIQQRRRENHEAA